METGELLWTDKSPGRNILHGQWSSPAAGQLGGVNQVIFGGGDGWVYSFKADRGKAGAPELLWKFDANPKTSEWLLGGRGTRNNIIATPVIYEGLVYVAVGQDPEHGEGEGHVWCIDPTLRGDVSPQLAVHVNDRTKIIPHRRLQAVDEAEGEIAIDNPNSAVIWHYSKFDQNGDGEFDFEEEMHRSCGTVAIKDDLLYISDFSGLFHCLDAKTGSVHWTYDMFAQAWGSPLIVDGKVYIGDEDGEVCVFELKPEPHEPIAVVDMGNSVYSTPIVANGVLYIANNSHLFAIYPDGK
jgi:outer membrane protein assembly factor BamB